MEPLVSILIPAFNAEEWLADTLESALAQTWRYLEIIVVDDESTDRTLQVARSFESRGVRVFSQPNAGAAAARNKAFELSSGSYIQWLDADDILAPDKIERQIAVARRDDDETLLYSAAWGRFLYRRRRSEFVPSKLWQDLSPAEWLIEKVASGAYMQTATWLVSRRLSLLAGPWDTRLLGDDDGEYFCRVLIASSGIRFVPDAKVFYRMAGSGSLSSLGRSSAKKEALLLSVRLHIEYMLSLENSKRSREAALACLARLARLCYPERIDLVQAAEELARSLGGTLEPPRLSWKYDWIRIFFGWSAAKTAQLTLQAARWSIQRRLDLLLLKVDDRRR